MDTILIGCGQIAETHLKAIKKLGHSVEWVVGRHPERTEAQIYTRFHPGIRG